MKLLELTQALVRALSYRRTEPLIIDQDGNQYEVTHCRPETDLPGVIPHVVITIKLKTESVNIYG